MIYKLYMIQPVWNQTVKLRHCGLAAVSTGAMCTISSEVLTSWQVVKSEPSDHNVAHKLIYIHHKPADTQQL